MNWRRLLIALLAFITIFPLSKSARGDSLYPNDPDPFCPYEGPTTIMFALQSASCVRLRVDDTFGNPFALLFDGALPAGYHAISWAGTDAEGDTVRTSLFTVVLETDHWPCDEFQPDQHYEDPATVYCGYDLEGPYRQRVAGSDVAVAFAVGWERPADVPLLILNAGDETLVRSFNLSFSEAGAREIVWDLRNESGDRVPGGFYICRLDTPEYAEDIVFPLQPMEPIHPSGTLTDVRGIRHPCSSDPDDPTVLETPILEGRFDFGRSLNRFEYEYLLENLHVDGSLELTNPDTFVVAPDTSGLSFPSVGAIRPWPDIYGPGAVRFDPHWADPPSFYVHLRHEFRGITCTDAECDTVGTADPEDWLCRMESREGGEPVEGYCLGPTCPNPAPPGGTTTVSWTLPERNTISLRVINTQGNVVRTLAEGMFMAGVHELVWDLRDDAGNPVPEGICRMVLEIGDGTGWDIVCGGDVWVGDLSAIGGPGDRPNTGIFLRCSPNPLVAGRMLDIIYDVPETMPLSLCIYDVGGRRVRLLQPRDVATPGRHVVLWDGRADADRRLAAGIYLVRLQAEGWRRTQRIVLLE